MVAEYPYSLKVTGDFNCRLYQSWENYIDSYEGKLLESITSDLGLAQLINEPTHLIGEYQSYINLLFTDQLNRVVEAGMHQTLHDQCHHQIINGILSLKNPAQPSYKRRLWYYDRADTVAIRKSIEIFPGAMPWRLSLVQAAKWKC